MSKAFRGCTPLSFRPREALSCRFAQVKSPVTSTEPSLVISRERSESRNLFLSALCLEQITLNMLLLIINELANILCEVAAKLIPPYIG